MGKFLNYIKEIWNSSSVKNKILFTIAILALYRLFVFIPVPFVNIEAFGELLNAGSDQGGQGGGLEYLSMLMGGAIERFSIVAVGLIPFINASIIMQLLSAVVPKLEELQEQGEVGTMKIQQYTRWITLPLAFLQGIGMVYFIGSTQGLIDTSSFMTVLLGAFVLAVGTIMLMWLGELITERGITNGISLVIFASIVSGMTSKISNFLGTSGSDFINILVFMLAIVLVLIILAILLLKTKKEVPVVYARQGKVEETSVLPIPLNPVGMIPIIFSIAFISFPYLLSQLVLNYGTTNDFVRNSSDWIASNLNIYTQNPSVLAISVYFLLIVAFTFFYTMITFNPHKIADNIQKKGGFIPGIRPGDETADYLDGILKHLSLWGGVGLGIVGIYSYVLSYIPFIQQATQSLGSIPVIVSGAGVIIIVGVVSQIVDKLNSELLMERYERI